MILDNILEVILKRNKRGWIFLLFLFMWIGVFLAVFFRQLDVSAAVSLSAPKGMIANGVDSDVVVSWEPVKGADGYEVFEKEKGQSVFTRVKVTTKKKVIFTHLKRGTVYYFKVRAYRQTKSRTIYGKFSKKTVTTVAVSGTTTLKNFLNLAIAPVGSTMYIWGGGWNKADTEAGADGLRIGLNPQWRDYASKQKASYNYKKTRYKRGYGLDCSGFVGWTVFNAFHTNKGKAGEGYVDKAKNLAKNYAENGWGTYTKAAAVKNYCAGDIMSSSGHVYIVIGQCNDGSVVLVHSSPAGVQLCGTVSPSGNKNSKAIQLAKAYMKKYYPSWYKRYPNCSRGISYLKDYNQFRWKLTKNGVMEDLDNYINQSPKAILNDLFRNS